MSDSSIYSSKKGLIRSKETSLFRNEFLQNTTPTRERDFDLSSSIFQDSQSRIFLDNTNRFDGSTSNIGSSFLSVEKTQVEVVETLFKEKTDSLFTHFLEVLQSRSNDAEIFDTVQDLIHTCSSVLELLQKEEQRSSVQGKHYWLEQEEKTWKLLYALYKDRIINPQDNMDADDAPPLNASEKEVVSVLYSNDSNIREYQLIVDWLESCFIKPDSIFVQHSADKSSIGWENTFYQLELPNQKLAFGGRMDIVNELDPDAPYRLNKPLHHLDEEDNLRLVKNIFYEVRQGKIDEAVSLCKYSGQTWRAAVLDGWRLYDDPNIRDENSKGELPTEGNARRDLWKKCAWAMAEFPKYDEYTKAIAGVFCGHLNSLLALLKTYEDILWAYLKVQIDIRVEQEIRHCCMREYVAMPESYWKQKMTMEQIFDELTASSIPAVKNEATSKVATIQKYLILDNIDGLIREMYNWIQEDSQEKVTVHELRFFSHILLFMRQLGKFNDSNSADMIIKKYVECLIELGEPSLVAFYTAALPAETQTKLYSKFLETVKTTADRSLALDEAMQAGLDVESITTLTVENIRNRQLVEEEGPMFRQTISNMDQFKISSLEYLTFYTEQRSELMWQANAMIRTFLAENKVDCMRKAFEIIPSDAYSHVVDFYGGMDKLPYKDRCTIKEYLSYKIYLAAIDSFDDWHRLHVNKPKEPELSKSKTNFTERMASQHKEQAYIAELNRWKMNLEEQTKISRDCLYNVLLFPEHGWLIDPEGARESSLCLSMEWENRVIQMDRLRSLKIPEITLFLHKILYASGDYKSCIKLADEISDENRCLYKSFPKHKLAEVLAKIAEASLALMNEKLDPWGYVIAN